MEKRQHRNGDDRRGRRYGYIQLVLVLLFIGGAFIFSRYLSSLQTLPSAEPGRSDLELLVETVGVEPRTYRLEFSSTGTIQVRALTDFVPQVSGRIVAIDDSAFPGGWFTPDTVLFRIEKEDYELEVERLKAEVARAETQLQIQKASSAAAVEEWRKLNPETSPPALVAEEPQLSEARATLSAAESQLKIARLNLDRTDYQLPFTGRVTEFRLERGQYVVAGQSYGQAYRVASLEVNVPLEKQKFDWLLETEDPGISFTTGFPDDKSYTARVKRLAGKLDPQTRFSRVVLGINEPKPDLLPDAFVHVRFAGPEKENVWVLPVSALQENGRIWTVTRKERLAALEPEIIQITSDVVVAKSNGNPIRVVLGKIPEATEGTRVRLAGDAGAGAEYGGR